MPRTKGSKNRPKTNNDYATQRLLASGMSADEILEKLK